MYATLNILTNSKDKKHYISFREFQTNLEMQHANWFC